MIGRPHHSNKNLAELAQGRLAPLIFKYAWPALVAMSLNALYAVVDRFYIGQGCGEDAMAGLTLTIPLMTLFGAFGVFVGAGHGGLLSIKLGENDRIACERLLGEMVALKVLFFIILPPLVFFNLDPILGWCGGSKVSVAAFADARRYLQIVLFFHIFAHLAFGLSATMRSEGAAVHSMICMVIGFGLNLILDPIFIFGFHMGIAGAAWATNLSMMASCFYALWYYWSGRSAVRLRLRRVWIYSSLIGRTSGIGFAPFLQQFLGAAICVSLSAAFALWAKDSAAATTQIASLGVFQSVMILTVMPILGAQQGIQPIMGYNWGARNFARVRKTLVLGLEVTTVLCFIASFVQVEPHIARFLCAIFVSNDNPGLLTIATHDLQISNCMIWTISLNVVATTYYQSIGHPKMAILLSTMRQGLILLPCIWLLPHLMERHMLAIWLALPISDVLCQVATLPPLLSQLRFLSKVRSREFKK